MPKKTTPEKAIRITWLSVLLTCCWPLSPSASKIRIICFKFLRTGCIASAMLLLLPLLFSTYVNYEDNFIASVRSFCSSTTVFQVVLQTLSLISQYDRLQYLIEEMKTFCKNATTEERVILQEYVDKYGTFYVCCIIWLYLSAAFDSVAFIFAGESLPLDTTYPFRVDCWPIRPIICCHQVFVAAQCAANISVNIFGALMLLFTAARFEIVTREMQKATDVPMLVACIVKYQQIRRYMDILDELCGESL